MSCEFKITRRVEFAETDLAGILHFSNFFRYMEVTEHAFLRGLGLSACLREREGEGLLGWPRVKAECTFTFPLRFEDRVEIHLVVREVHAKGVRYDFLFSKLAYDCKILAARGNLDVLYARLDAAKGTMKVIEIPPAIREKITPAPPLLLHSLGLD
ncbi:MAG: thioesterase family protein [Opitutales bacterium]